MCSTLHLPAYNYPFTIEPCHYPGGKQCIVIYYNDFRTSIYSSFVPLVLQMTGIYEIINWCMELSMDILVFCNDATLQRYSPNTWLKILSKLTSFFFSRYLCITLRTLKTKEEPVNRGRHIPVSNKSHFCSSCQVYKHHVSRFSWKVNTQLTKKAIAFLEDSQPLDHITKKFYLPSSRSLVLLLKESHLYPSRDFHAYLPRFKQPCDTSN